jgi:hypothetical protein
MGRAAYITFNGLMNENDAYGKMINAGTYIK